MRDDGHLAAYVKGELDTAERAEVLAALKATPALQAELRKYQRLVAALHATATAELHPSPELRGRIGRRIAQQYAVRRVVRLLGGLADAYARALVTYFGVRSDDR